MNFAVTSDFDTFRRNIAHVPTDVEKQFAFGLNKLARAVQAEVRDQFDDYYIMRSAYMRSSIIINGASKSRLEARVGTMNHLLALHLFGGKKDGNVAMSGIRGSDKRGKVTRKTTVDSLMSRMDKSPSDVFAQNVKGKTYIFKKIGQPVARQRVRNGNSGPVLPRTPVSRMWLLMGGGKITVRADWPIEKIYQDVVDRRADQIFADVIEDAWNHAVERGRVWG